VRERAEKTNGRKNKAGGVLVFRGRPPICPLAWPPDAFAPRRDFPESSASKERRGKFCPSRVPFPSVRQPMFCGLFPRPLSTGQPNSRVTLPG